MDELMVAQNLVEKVEAELARHPTVVGSVSAVRVRVGELSGVTPDALALAFRSATAGTCTDGADLEIDRVAPVIWCEKCDSEKLVSAKNPLRCPTCGQKAHRLLRGGEVELVSLKVTAPEPGHAEHAADDGPRNDRITFAAPYLAGSPADPEEQ